MQIATTSIIATALVTDVDNVGYRNDTVVAMFVPRGSVRYNVRIGGCLLKSQPAEIQVMFMSAGQDFYALIWQNYRFSALDQVFQCVQTGDFQYANVNAVVLNVGGIRVKMFCADNNTSQTHNFKKEPEVTQSLKILTLQGMGAAAAFTHFYRHSKQQQHGRHYHHHHQHHHSQNLRPKKGWNCQNPAKNPAKKVTLLYFQF